MAGGRRCPGAQRGAAGCSLVPPGCLPGPAAHMRGAAAATAAPGLSLAPVSAAAAATTAAAAAARCPAAPHAPPQRLAGRAEPAAARLRGEGSPGSRPLALPPHSTLTH